MEATFDRRAAAVAAALPHLLSLARAELQSLAAAARAGAMPGGGDAGASLLATPAARRRRAAALDDAASVAGLICRIAAGALALPIPFSSPAATFFFPCLCSSATLC